MDCIYNICDIPWMAAKHYSIIQAADKKCQNTFRSVAVDSSLFMNMIKAGNRDGIPALTLFLDQKSVDCVTFL